MLRLSRASKDEMDFIVFNIFPLKQLNANDGLLFYLSEWKKSVQEELLPL